MIKNICLIMFLTIGSYVYGQQTGCTVKMTQISGSYSGGCKKGLAHGKGIAQGIDHYEGEFSKGMPEGTGVYRWANGAYYEGEWKNGMRYGQGKYVNGDTVLTGYWKDNKYQGQKLMPSYKINLNRNVARFTIIKSVESGTGVKVKLLLGGSDNSEIEDFSMVSTSGTEFRNAGTYGVENAVLPYEVTIRYTTWNQLHTVQYEVLFEFTILAPGTWNVAITNY